MHRRVILGPHGSTTLTASIWGTPDPPHSCCPAAAPACPLHARAQERARLSSQIAPEQRATLRTTAPHTGATIPRKHHSLAAHGEGAKRSFRTRSYAGRMAVRTERGAPFSAHQRLLSSARLRYPTRPVSYPAVTPLLRHGARMIKSEHYALRLRTAHAAAYLDSVHVDEEICSDR